MDRDKALAILARRRCDNNSCSHCNFLHYGDDFSVSPAQPTNQELLEAEQVLKVALSSPCACGGAKVLAEVKSRAEIYGVEAVSDKQYFCVPGHDLNFTAERLEEEFPIRILILEEKPNES